MTLKNYYKPRNTIVYVTKSKVWPSKNAYLRRFYAIRSRRLRREQGLFRRCVLVATSRKWVIVRRFIRPLRQSVRSRTISSTNKKAYGRPYKRRYRARFYAKQQLRFFHGEVKETSFRNSFRKHANSRILRNKSFFSNIESRLDIIFFRMRLLPTVFACRQFIIHQGLDVNSIVERSPYARISTGDRVAVSEIAWENLYWELLMRIYYRRWGLYIRRRRLYKQRKKPFFFRRQRSTSQLSALSHIIKIRVKPINFVGLKTEYNRVVSHKENGADKPTNAVEAIYGENDIKSFAKTIYKLSPDSTNIIQLLGTYNKSFFNRYASSVKQSIHDNNSPTKVGSYPDISFQENNLFAFNRMGHDLRTYAEKLVGMDNLFKRKCSHYLKLAFSLRFRKSALPSKFRYKFKGKHQRKDSSVTFKRTKLLRLYFKKYKKTIQNKKIIRLKAVHFFIPSYLQIDFRTLRAVKVQSAAREKVFYPFRISLAKRHSFYRSRGY